MPRAGAESDPRLRQFKSRLLQLGAIIASVSVPVIGGGWAMYRGVSGQIDTVKIKVIRIESQMEAQKGRAAEFWQRDWPSRGRRMQRIEVRLRRLETELAALRAVVKRRYRRHRR